MNFNSDVIGIGTQQLSPPRNPINTDARLSAHIKQRVASAAWREKWYPPIRVSMVLDALVDAGISASSALAGTGLDHAAVKDANTRTSIQQYYRVLQNTAHLERPSDLGARVAARTRATRFGTWGFALLSANTMQAALELSIRYRGIIHPLVPITIAHSPVALILSFPLRNKLQLPDLDDRIYQTLMEVQVAMSASLIKDVMGDWCKPRSVQLPWAQPNQNDGLSAILGYAVQYGQAQCELRYPKDWLQRKPRLADPQTAMQLAAACQKLFEEMGRRGTYSREVYAELTRQSGQFPTLAAIATKLSIHERTLRRHLESENTSYNRLLDSVRRSLADNYLQETKLSMDEIAHALGFSDARSFRQAYRRWTGRAPSTSRYA